MGKKGTPHRKFSKEEKMKYVRLHLDEHVSLMQIEREYGIRNTLVQSGLGVTYRTEKRLWSLVMAILTLHFIVVRTCQR